MCACVHRVNNILVPLISLSLTSVKKRGSLSIFNQILSVCQCVCVVFSLSCQICQAGDGGERFGMWFLLSVTTGASLLD